MKAEALGNRQRSAANLLVVHDVSLVDLGSLGAPTPVPPYPGLGTCLRGEGGLTFSAQLFDLARCI